MSTDDYRQLVVRVDPTVVKKLKLFAAYEDVSMAEVVREALGSAVTSREKKKAYRDLVEAGK